MIGIFVKPNRTEPIWFFKNFKPNRSHLWSFINNAGTITTRTLPRYPYEPSHLFFRLFTPVDRAQLVLSIGISNKVDLQSSDILVLCRTMQKHGFSTGFLSISPIWLLCPLFCLDLFTPVDRARRVLSIGV